MGDGWWGWLLSSRGVGEKTGKTSITSRLNRKWGVERHFADVSSFHVGTPITLVSYDDETEKTRRKTTQNVSLSFVGKEKKRTTHSWTLSPERAPVSLSTLDD